MTLAGRLLVATPRLGDPNFARAVVLVVDHDDNGTLGVIVNRPTELPVADILPSWQAHVSTPGVVFQGGPVALDSALAIAGVPVAGSGDGDRDARGEPATPVGWRRVSGSLGLVDLDAPPELVAPWLSGMRVFAGYAGWGPGQLVAELEEGAWFVLDSEAADPFTATPERLWRDVLRRQGGDLAMVATYPADPTAN